MDEKDFEKEYQKLLKDYTILKAKYESKRKVSPYLGLLSKKLSLIILGRGLKKSLKKFYSETPSSENTAEVTAHLIWRLFKIELLTILLGFIPIVILIIQTFLINSQTNLFDQQNSLVEKQLKQIEKQNTLFENQNSLLSQQTTKLEQQTTLSESNRRSSLIFLMSNVLDKLDDELKANKGRKISTELSARIISLSNSFKPYFILEGNQISKQRLSPERGQLLVALVKSNLNDADFIYNILASSNFSFSDLRNVDLRDANITNSRLNNSNFAGATLSGSSFRLSMIKDSDFSGADLRNVDFQSTYLCNANFENADLTGANFKNSIIDLDKINLKGAKYNKEQFKDIIPSCE